MWNDHFCGGRPLMVVVAVMAGCGGPAPNRDADRPDPGKTAAPSPPAADFVVNVSELLAAFREDRQAYRDKYAGKQIELTGYFKEIEITPAGGAVVALTEGPSEVLLVGCSTIDPRPWTKAMPGQSVKVRGTLADPSKFPAL